MRNVLMLFFMFFIAGSACVSGQQSAIYTNNLSEFDNAVSLYKDKQYQSAQILFERVKHENTNLDVQADCAYYIGICAIHLNQNNADELVEKFISDYPTSSKQNKRNQPEHPYLYSHALLFQKGFAPIDIVCLYTAKLHCHIQTNY